MSDTEFSVVSLSAVRDSSINTAFMDFNNAVTNDPEALFVFYEGQDDDYYYPRLKQYANRNIEPIKCNGKSKVIEIYKLLVAKPEYNKYHKGFFIDKDFDLNTDHFLSDFFLTRGYSIENYYISETCIESLLKQKFNFHSGDSDLALIMSNYQKVCHEFFDAILLFNTWYCAIKRKYGKLEGISLNQDMPKGFVRINFSASYVQSNYSMSDILGMFPKAVNYPVDSKDLADARAYIKGDMQKNLRGKYLLDFLNKYLNYLIEEFRTNPALSAHKRIINIQYNNIMCILSPFSDTEDDLIKYIKKVAA